MLQRPESACLVIADISGYTGFLAGSELDHAQDILGDLIGTVIGSLRGRFKLAKLEGDAAFFFALTEQVDASSFLDHIEATYFAFRRRLRDIRQATSCTCNACRLIPSLDLKFVAHHGTVIRQRLAGREELVGADVIVVHRLLKNHVVEELGLAAYALITSACVAAMGVDPATFGLRPHREAIDVLGDTAGWVLNLDEAWTAELARTRVRLDERTSIKVRNRLPLTAAQSWDYLTTPALRANWQLGVDRVLEAPAVARRGIGTTNHCVHGEAAVIEEILDWSPYDYVTLRSALPIPGVPKLRTMISFEPVEGATDVVFYLEPPRAGPSSANAKAILEDYKARLDASFVELNRQLAATGAVPHEDAG